MFDSITGGRCVGVIDRLASRVHLHKTASIAPRSKPPHLSYIYFINYLYPTSLSFLELLPGSTEALNHTARAVNLYTV